MEETLIGKILLVGALATFEIYVAIPTGFAFGFSPWWIFTICVIGGLAGVFVTAYLGDMLRNLIRRGKEPKPKKTSNWANKLWEKYGMIGLGLAGTFTVGAPISIAVGVGFNANIHKLVFWSSVGVILRCAVFTSIGHFGTQLL